MIEMFVGGLAFDEQTNHPLVVLNDEQKRRALPIWIGLAEASAISRGLQGEKSPRPMTHDLLLNTITALGYFVEQVEINETRESTFYATVRLAPLASAPAGTAPKAIDARPSDAIALALRAQSPIFVTGDIMEESTVPLETEEEDAEAEEFKQFLEGLKASDFKIDGPELLEETEETPEGHPPAPAGPEQERAGEEPGEGGPPEKPLAG